MDAGSDEQVEPGTKGGTPLYYVGRVGEFFGGRGVGTVFTRSGREVPFDLRFCRIGSASGFLQPQEIESGTPVAFDMGWTSSGLRITWMRPVDEQELERQPSAEGEIAAQDAADEDR